MVKLLIGAVLLAAGLYCILALSLFLFQRRLIYHPALDYHTPAQADLDGVAEKRLATPDGESLIAWRAMAAPGQPTLLYFHGNAGGLIERADRIKRFQREGLGVMLLAYRGYSGSTGTPSEAALIADAQLAHDNLIAEGVKADQIVVYGESLGTGVAVQLAATRPVGAVILDAPYTGLAAIGERLYPWMPVRWFLKDKFASSEHIGAVRAPLLILHGSRDRTIPVSLGQALFEVAPSPKQMRVLEGAGHSDIYAFGAMQLISGFLDEMLRRPAPLAP